MLIIELCEANEDCVRNMQSFCSRVVHITTTVLSKIKHNLGVREGGEVGSALRALLDRERVRAR